MDVLVPKIGEIIGGSQREDDEERLRARMAAMNVPMGSLEWYMELRKFGTCPHAGAYSFSHRRPNVFFFICARSISLTPLTVSQALGWALSASSCM